MAVSPDIATGAVHCGDVGSQVSVKGRSAGLRLAAFFSVMFQFIGGFLSDFAVFCDPDALARGNNTGFGRCYGAAHEQC